MPDRTLIASATNLLARGYLIVPTDRSSPGGEPVNALFAVARGIQRAVAFKTPARAIAVMERVTREAPWSAQLERLPALLEALGLHVIEVGAGDEVHVVASYVQAALELGDDVIVAGVDKRYAQLVAEGVWWYDANKDVRYTPEIVEKRFGVPAGSVGEWLALVGDDSGNEVLPGVKGIGAKGAKTLIDQHDSIEAALASVEALQGRLGKALAAVKDDVPRELARARLDRKRALPIAIDDQALAYRQPDRQALNAIYQELGFLELLSAQAGGIEVSLCEQAPELASAIAALGQQALAVQLLMEDSGSIAGVAIANGEGRACWVPGDSAASGELAGWLADERAAKVGHDLAGTIAELSRAGIALRGIVGDSACASHLKESSNWAPHDLAVVSKHVLGRALPEEESVRGVGKQRKAWREISASRLAEYAGCLADACGAIWHELAPTLEPKSLLAEYLELTELCARMQLTGIGVDRRELDRAEQAFGELELELERGIFALAGKELNINSSKQLGSLLFEQLGLPVVSRTKTGWSTSIEALERIEHAHPIVGLVLRWRALRRLRDNWVIALRRAIEQDGRVHSRFHPARSFSGQIVNSNPDLGRVPGRTPEMARIRRAFVAAPGQLLMSVDFNQLGLHVLAHLTKDPELIRPLGERRDMHVLTAAAVLEVAPQDVSEEQRQLGKVVNFATFAGQGASALALQLGVTAKEAKDYIARFDAHYAKVRAFQDQQLELAKTRGYIVTLAGRRWPIGGLESLDPHARSYAERLARRATHEASVQDVSRRALLEAERAIRREGLGAKPLLQILDEVLFEVPEHELAECARVCAHAMKHAYELEVPLAVGVWAGTNWAELEPVPQVSAET